MDTPNKKYRPKSAYSTAEIDFKFSEVSDVGTAVKSSASPHFTKLVVGIAIASLVVVSAIVVVCVLFVGKDKDGDESIPPGPPQNLGDTTTPTHATLPTTDPNLQGAQWILWGEWTACTSTCGSGIHKRYRTCSSTDSICVGDYIDQEVCNVGSCPVYGKWTTWSQWGSCDKTCGTGVRTRSRTCNTGTGSTDLGCVGSDSQNQECSTWNCPDCSHVCETGTLNSECDTCICDSTTINGRVVALETLQPVGGANIFYASAPVNLLVSTNNTGHFTLTSTCVSSELMVSRNGFLDQTVTVNSTDIQILMTRTVPPHFTEDPQSKYRLSGERVTLCCFAEGIPEIDYYEWMKDSILLDKTLYPNGTHLQLTHLQPSDSGLYSCRANSEVGTAFSYASTLMIKDAPGEYCTDALQQKTIALPSNCVQSATNTATYEVGECISKQCRENSSSDQGTCQEDSKSCCKTGNAVLKTIACSGYELDILVIQSCACGPCLSSSLQLSGTAKDIDSDSVVKFGQVFINGNLETLTSISGTFVYSVPSHTNELVITIVDNYFKQFISTTKVVKISDEMTGTVALDIHMTKVPDPFLIESDIENVISANSSIHNGSDSVQISIPANAFTNPDGSPYSGTVYTSFTFLDPPNSTSTTNLPGIFQFVDEEGETANLASQGVFNLFFADSNGNQLGLTDPVDVILPSHINSTDYDLWILSTLTGKWELLNYNVVSRRRKRQFSAGWVGAVDPAFLSLNAWFNIDKVISPEVCYLKVRAYEGKSQTTEILNPRRFFEIEQYWIEDSVPISIWTWTTNPAESCVSVSCSDQSGYITVLNLTPRDLEALYPGDPISMINIPYQIYDKVLGIEFQKSDSGPFYSDRSTCIASSKSDSHLPFHYGKNDLSWIFNEYFLDIPLHWPIETILVTNKKSWYPNRDSEGYRACYIKIKISFNLEFDLYEGQYVKLVVSNYGGPFADISGQILGIKEHEINDVSADTTLCMEYKCSGDINAELNPEYDETNVTVTILVPDNFVTCRVVGESLLLQELGFSNIGNSTFSTFVPNEYTPDHGLYSASSDKLSIENAQNSAEGQCLSGTSKSNRDVNPELGLAVEFLCQNYDYDWSIYDWLVYWG